VDDTQCRAWPVPVAPMLRVRNVVAIQPFPQVAHSRVNPVVPLFVAHVGGEFVAQHCWCAYGRPHAHGVIVASGGGELPVTPKRHTPNRFGVYSDRLADGLAAIGVPHPNGAVLARRGEPMPVGAERETVDPTGLRRISQSENVKLAVIAHRLVDESVRRAHVRYRES
jgi:hypothetical protein